MRRALEPLRPDVTIAGHLYGASMAPLVAARRAGGPVVAQPADKWLLHGLYEAAPAAPTAPRTLGWVAGLARPALRRLARPHYVLAISEFIRSLHVRAGFPAESSANPPRRARGRVSARTAPAPREGHGGSSSRGSLGRKGPQSRWSDAPLKERGDTPPCSRLFGAGTNGSSASARPDREGWGRNRVTLRGLVTRKQLAESSGCITVPVLLALGRAVLAGLLEAMRGPACIATATGGTPRRSPTARTGCWWRRPAQELADAVCG